MMDYRRHSDREKLEIIFNSSAANLTKKTKSVSFLRRIWKQLVTAIAREQELQIWQRSDRGKTWWHGYDPRTGRSVCRSSEAEMRAWIEQSYYQ
jgi:hypothetical protein